MRTLWVVFILVAGCTSPTIQEGQEGTATTEGRPIIGFEGDRVVARSLGVDAVAWTTAYNGSEPSLGFQSDGDMFVVARNVTLRSTDGGATFEPVHDFFALRGRGTEDPWLWIDPVTDEVWVDHLYYFGTPVQPPTSCTDLSRSDDDGATWQRNEAACWTPMVDHQKLTTGAPGPDAVTGPADAPRWAYLCYNEIDRPRVVGFSLTDIRATTCTTSRDGGVTWPTGSRPFERATTSCGGLSGPPAAGPDGALAIAASTACGAVHVAVSTDSGLHWATQLTPFKADQRGLMVDPWLAWDDAGHLYLAFVDEDGITRYGRSDDQGETWQGPWRATPPGLGTTALPAMAAVGDGRLAVAFLATEDVREDVDVPPDAVWHLWIVVMDEEGQGTGFRATDDPVQIGCLRITEGQAFCRNHREFIGVQVAPNGTVFVAFTDGCVADCATAVSPTDSMSRARFVAFARLDGHPLR